jgi:uncharacterized protein YaiL (DUF2058 family)
MGNSLQEQLLKAGLIDQKRIEQAEQDKRNKARQAKPGKKAARARPAKPAPTAEQLEKAEKDRELARQRQEVQRQREVAAQVRQLVRSHRVARVPADDDIPFNFDNKGKIKRLYVSPALHRQISAGQLVIVNDNGVFELVPPPIAEKIRQRNPSLVIDLPEDKPADADDPYAGYQVPDDLIW